MLEHVLLISYRSFLQNKGSFFINLIGLSTGLVCAMLIYLWVNDELNVDRFHKNDDRLYQIMTNLSTPKGITTMELTPALLAEDLPEKLPEIESSTNSSVSFMSPEGVITEQENTLRTKGLFVGESFFNVFSYSLLEGNPDHLLNDGTSIVISEKLAITLFQSPEKAMGQDLRWSTSFFDTTFYVTGVFKDIPSNSTTQFDAAVSFENWLIATDPDVAVWSDGYAETYIVLKEGVDQAQFEQKIGSYLHDKHEFWGPSTLFTRKYSSQYLKGEYENGVQVGGRMSYVTQFSILAFFILLIACINFMNLSTAQASRKMKEIGVKKAIGASRKFLMFQFLMESMAMVILSFFIAGLLVSLLLPEFNELTNKTLDLNLSFESILVIIGILILTGCIAGSYPAYILIKL